MNHLIINQCLKTYNKHHIYKYMSINLSANGNKPLAIFLFKIYVSLYESMYICISDSYL